MGPSTGAIGSPTPADVAEAAARPPGSGPSVEAHFFLEEADLVAFSLAWSKRSGEQARSLRGSFALAALPVLAGVGVLVLGDVVLGGALIAVGVALAAGAVPSYRQSVKDQIRRRTRSAMRPGLYGIRRVMVANDGITDSGEWDALHVKWPAVLDVIETDHGLYFVYGPGQAIIVPKRSLDSEQHAADLLDLARVYRTRAGW